MVDKIFELLGFVVALHLAIQIDTPDGWWLWGLFTACQLYSISKDFRRAA